MTDAATIAAPEIEDETLLDFNACIAANAARLGDKPALEEAERALSWAETGAAVARIAAVALAMHDTAAKFARRQKDAAFSYRLALGLARSFASSTRFVADRDHARRMMLRARYLLETALAVPEGKEARFRPPIGELFRE